MRRPASLLEGNRWFAWYPVPLVIDGKLHYAWLQSVERRDRSTIEIKTLGSFCQIRG
jgi:hypothetical protein